MAKGVNADYLRSEVDGWVASMERLITLNDVLRAWQDGRIRYREAMSMAGVDTLDELYDAAHLSGVPIRTTFTADEIAHGLEVAPIIREGVEAARAS